jgi:hypothetical protein
VAIPLPFHPDVPEPDENIIPQVMPSKKFEPLQETPAPIECIATLWEPFWGDSYIILTPCEGFSCPKVSPDGQRVMVQFSPPVQP